MSENRAHARYVVEGMGVYAKTMFNTTVEVLELGVSGALIRDAQRFLIGCEYMFKIAHADMVIPLKALIIWKKMTMEKIPEGGVVPVYTAGVEFRDVVSDKAELLKGLISDRMRELKDRRLSGVRVKIHPPEKALISYMEQCLIRDISLGGLRMEAEQEPPTDMMFTLELSLAKNEQPVHCKGRIAFCHEATEKTPRRYCVGVEFRDLAESDKSRIEKFIGKLS
jgi:hypothetical protein